MIFRKRKKVRVQHCGLASLRLLCNMAMRPVQKRAMYSSYSTVRSTTVSMKGCTPTVSHFLQHLFACSRSRACVYSLSHEEVAQCCGPLPWPQSRSPNVYATASEPPRSSALRACPRPNNATTLAEVNGTEADNIRTGVQHLKVLACGRLGSLAVWRF